MSVDLDIQDWPFVFSHLNTTVSTFCEWLWQIRMVPYGWWLTSYTILLLHTLSSVTLSVFHQMERTAFVHVWMRHCFNRLMHFILQKQCLYFIQNQSSWFWWLSRLFCMFITVISFILGIKYMFYIKNNLLRSWWYSRPHLITTSPGGMCTFTRAYVSFLQTPSHTSHKGLQEVIIPFLSVNCTGYTQNTVEWK